MIEQGIKDAVKEVVFLLVEGKFSEVVRLSKNGQLTEMEIALALSDYPGELTAPPERAFENVVVYEACDDCPEVRSAEFELWYDNQESDLSLCFQLRELQGGGYDLKLDDIRVL